MTKKTRNRLGRWCLWAHYGIMCDYTKKRVSQSARLPLDIPIFPEDEAGYVKEMVEAMKVTTLRMHVSASPLPSMMTRDSSRIGRS